MTHLSIIAFHTVGFGFVRHGRVQPRRVEEYLVSRKQIAVVEMGLWRVVNQAL